MDGPKSLVVRDDGDTSPSIGVDGIDGLDMVLDQLEQVARTSTGDKLIESVESMFDLFDDSLRTKLAVRAAVEERSGSSDGTAAVIATAVRIVSEKKLEAAGLKLRQLLAVSKGDVKALTALVDSLIRKVGF